MPADMRQLLPSSRLWPKTNLLCHKDGGARLRDVSKESGLGLYPRPNLLFHDEGTGTFRVMALDAGVAYNDEWKFDPRHGRESPRL